MTPLPIDAVLPSILKRLRRSPNLVLRAPPGAGKTTRLPPALLDSGLLPAGERILVLEPRRVAARAAARQIARERRVELGKEVGYQVRFDNRTSRSTRIVLVTEGLLARKLESDPSLEGVGAVILDEFHERSIHVDLALAFLKEIQETIRPELRIVVMSATIDVDPIARYLGGCEIVDVDVKSHPVETRYFEKKEGVRLEERSSKMILRALRESEGDVLAFLPGAREIRQTHALLAEMSCDVDLHDLYGDLSPEAQDRALQRGRRRKVILATNIAETSLTIDGVSIVVDTGLAKVLRHDPARGVERLGLERISRASADQRAGRAGRLGPGIVYRMWSEREHPHLEAQDVPEIRRIDLASATLDVIGWCAKAPSELDWFDPPPAAQLERSVALLRALGAVERDTFRLTPLGNELRSLPLHPRIGRTLIAAAELGVVEEGALLAALAAERDIVRDRAPLEDLVESSDLWVRAERFAELERRRFSESAARQLGLDLRAVRSVRRARDQLADIARRRLEVKARAEPTEERLLRVLFAGFADRVAKRRAPGDDRVVLVGGRGARLAKDSVVKSAELLLAIELSDAPHPRSKKESWIRLASAVRREWLELEQVDVVRFNEARRAVESSIETRFFDLVIDSKVSTTPDPEQVSACLAEHARRSLPEAFAIDERVEALQNRLSFLSRARPELELPAFGIAEIEAQVDRLCFGLRSFAELEKIDLAARFAGELDFHQRQILEREAPERIEVPSGSQVRLRYEVDGPPVLAVRLQEIFGLDETPRVAGGRVPLKLELLAPNRRPVQVTRDLPSFWRGAYLEVRKTLRARYPKHAWPEDPLTAEPERRPRRKRRG